MDDRDLSGFDGAGGWNRGSVGPRIIRSQIVSDTLKISSSLQLCFLRWNLDVNANMPLQRTWTCTESVVVLGKAQPKRQFVTGT